MTIGYVVDNVNYHYSVSDVQNNDGLTVAEKQAILALNDGETFVDSLGDRWTCTHNALIVGEEYIIESTDIIIAEMVNHNVIGVKHKNGMYSVLNHGITRHALGDANMVIRAFAHYSMNTGR